MPIRWGCHGERKSGDRSLCLELIISQFPSLIDDVHITCEGIRSPGEDSFHAKAISLHLFRFRQIQSEIRTVLFEKPHPAYAELDMITWQKSMHDRIQAWFNETPRAGNPTPYQVRDLELFELSFHRAIFYLYHPSPNITTLSEPMHATLTDAATHVIELYRKFFLERRITLYWQAVENISSAGIALMFTYVHSSLVRERIGFYSLETLIRSCSSILWGVVEHFPAFNSKRDEFDVIASKVLATLTTTSAAREKVQDHLNSENPTNNGVEMCATNLSPPWLEGPRQDEVSNLLRQHFATTTSTMSGSYPPLQDLSESQSIMQHHLDEAAFQIPPLNGQASFDWEALQDPTNFLTSTWV